MRGPVGTQGQRRSAEGRSWVPSTSGCSPGLAPTCRLLIRTDSCSAWYRWASLCPLLPMLRDRHQHPFYRLDNQSSDSTSCPRSWPEAMALE